MMTWLYVALLGGMVGLDGTSFPQVMISRPLVAGALTGLIFGRPVEGLAAGLVLEAFALTTLPIGAARYPEAGTAVVAATAALLAATPGGMEPGYLALALAFALGWERLAALTVVLQRRANGRMLIRSGAMAAEKLERRHLAAMTLDFTRGAVVSVGGGLLGFALLGLLGPYWGLPAGLTAALLLAITAAMIGTAIALFGGLRSRLVAVVGGLAVGLLALLVLP
jgi:mannose/fructose/N-acetylgalactosamine-specific phosphotransferase system component IIC